MPENRGRRPAVLEESNMGRDLWDWSSSSSAKSGGGPGQPLGHSRKTARPKWGQKLVPRIVEKNAKNAPTQAIFRFLKKITRVCAGGLRQKAAFSSHFGNVPPVPRGLGRVQTPREAPAGKGFGLEGAHVAGE